MLRYMEMVTITNTQLSLDVLMSKCTVQSPVLYWPSSFSNMVAICLYLLYRGYRSDKEVVGIDSMWTKLMKRLILNNIL